MRVNDDGRTVGAIDVLAPRIGEIIGAASARKRPDVLDRGHGGARHRSGALRLVPGSAALTHAGLGLGFERTLAYALANVRDAIPLPRTPGNAE